jgi:DNA-directed RNA polymerase subunit RPC12/RpoP
MAINKPFGVQSDMATDPIQCTACGDPNVYGRLCEACAAKVDEIMTSDKDTIRVFVALGLQRAKTIERIGVRNHG